MFFFQTDDSKVNVLKQKLFYIDDKNLPESVDRWMKQRSTFTTTTEKTTLFSRVNYDRDDAKRLL